MSETVLCKNCKHFFGFEIDNRIINITATIIYDKINKLLNIRCVNCNSVLGIEISLICSNCLSEHYTVENPINTILEINEIHKNFSENGCKKCFKFDYSNMQFFDKNNIMYAKKNNLLVNNFKKNKKVFLYVK